jgi:hypothetical protein
MTLNRALTALLLDSPPLHAFTLSELYELLAKAEKLGWERGCKYEDPVATAKRQAHGPCEKCGAEIYYGHPHVCNGE